MISALNATGQIADLSGMGLFALIDPDTPQEARTKKGVDGEDLVLVFSDEFNTDGRSFYPGDDPLVRERVEEARCYRIQWRDDLLRLSVLT